MVNKVADILYEDYISKIEDLENIVRSQKIIIKNLEMTIDALEQYIEEINNKLDKN